MIIPNKTSWVILAGGQASRMGGRDKGLIEFLDKPLIEHVVKCLSNQTSNLFINANRNLESYQKFAVVFSDKTDGFLGPVSGFQSGLNYATTDWVGFVPCDCPFISPYLVTRFCQAANENVDIVVAHDGQYPQPVFTLMHKRILPQINAFLLRGERKITRLYTECNTHYVDFSDSPRNFINLNTPEELAILDNSYELKIH
ncbi:molybdenum cofactor guanylyltransferase MobA [Vibrio sagamiensis]|nr:molybdenum cofactor guanylyltransferase MobA [Vibrio sagamiensis]PNQ61099.1 molybdenum cofactor guanylyltransferase MobA [Vibrio agarivorans]